MIIKPNLGMRIFWGASGAVLFLLACAGLTIPFPGLLFTCLGLPLGVFAFGFAFGISQTRVDDNGITQRNFFFRSQKLEWAVIESGRIVSGEYRQRNSATGWTESRKRTLMDFNGNGIKIRINANSTGPENWWHEIRRIAKEKMGDKFQG